MMFRLHFIVLAAACTLAAQNVAAPGGVRTIPAGDHSAVWIGESGPSGPMGAISLRGADVRFEGPPVVGAPYSAEAATEVVQTLADGNRIRHETRTKIYRDSEGRTRREEKLNAAGPWAPAASDAEMIFINDPVAGVHWVIDPQSKTARKMPVPQIRRLQGMAGNAATQIYTESIEVKIEDGEQHETVIQRRAESSSSSAASANPPPIHLQRMASPLAGAMTIGSAEVGEAETEQLGERTIEGVLTNGVRRTRTIKAGQIGNERPIEVIFEEWRSEELGVTVKSIRSDPRSGVTTYELKNIQRTNPPPTLFEPPAGYEIIEMPAFARARTIELERE